MQEVARVAAAMLAALTLAGCAAQTGPSGTSQDGKPSWMPNMPFATAKGEKTPVISTVKAGPYAASSLAVGEEKDLAQRRAEGLGFVRSAPLEQYLRALHAELIAASGITGVPGRVTLLASPAYAAYSTPDGNVYVAMAWVKQLESADEVAALLAHEISHVLLAHHSSDVLADMQHKSQALHEIAVSAKASLSGKSVSKSDARGLSQAQMIADATDKLVLPAWNRTQEREADLLGVDLMVRAKYSPAAMVTMLEKLKAWEELHRESDDAFWQQVGQSMQTNPGQALNLTYQKVVSAVAVSHPKTAERIDDVAQYLDRHYGDTKLPDTRVAPWKGVTTRADVVQLITNYDQAFKARQALDANKALEAYAHAKVAATAPTATDAYPNWVLARSAASLNRQQEAVTALQRAIASPDPVPQVYEDLILVHERSGNVATALAWTDRAWTTFAGAPRWRPVKIRLLRKSGRTGEAETLTLDCSLNAPDWRRLCQEANQTPAPTQAPASTTPRPRPPSQGAPLR